MATATELEIKQDGVVSFDLIPGTLELLQQSMAECHVLIKCFQGSVTLVSPGETHDSVSRRVLLFIVAISEVLKVKAYPLGSTYHGLPGDTGYEPDESFYVQSEGAAMSGKVPDLAIEIVVTSSPRKALAAGEALGIPEMWVWNISRRELVFHGLKKGKDGKTAYRPIVKSLAFPLLTPKDVLSRVNEPIDDAGAFAAKNRAWARRVLVPRTRKRKGKAGNGDDK